MNISLSKLLNPIPYIVIQENAEINTDENSVIFGSNGIGKTTIYRQLKEQYPGFDYLDYDEAKNLLSKKQKNIEISLGTEKIEQLSLRNEELNNRLSVKNRLKDKKTNDKIATQKSAREVSTILSNMIKKDKIENLKITGEDCNGIEKASAYIPFVLKNKDKLIDIADITEDLKIIDKNYLKNVLKIIDKHLSSSDDTCPVCGSRVLNLKEQVQEKIKVLSEIKNEQLKLFISEYDKNNQNGSTIQSDFDSVIEVAKKYDEEILVEYYILDGNAEEIPIINDFIKEKHKIEKEYNDCLAKQNELFNSLKNQQHLYTDHLKRYFKADVKFDDEKKIVTISFDRSVEEHSTGELNLILFITKIFGYLGNDKECLFIDDPISSYDLVNQYNIVFQLCKLIENKDKHVVVFTHNPDVINIVNSQNNNAYKYFFFDLVKGKVIINALVPNIGNNPNILNLDILANEEDENGKYISLMLKRNDNDPSDYQSSVLHYDSDTGIVPLDERANQYKGCSNQFFIDYIENNVYSKELERSDFDHLCKSKIIALTAIRIWIEYKLCNSTSLCLKRKFGEKVATYFKNKDKITIQYPNLTREMLMSKKVMLNQNCHQNSQMQPFYYALSLKSDDIVSEIEEIKLAFHR